MASVSTTGDAGDTFGLACVIKSMPNGPHRLLLRDDGRTKGIVNRAHLITPLLNAQDYLTCEVWDSKESIDWASEGFRDGFHSTTHSLVKSHENHGRSVGIIRNPVNVNEPWMTVTPSPATKDRVVIARSPRYQNPHFPHKKIRDIYGKSLLFIGLKEEHDAYQRAYGRVEYLPCKDFLEVAEAIAGSFLAISNQTAFWWVASALGHKRILEVSTSTCDSIIKTGDAQFVIDGEVTLPMLDGSEVLIPSPVLDVCFKVNTDIVPPLGGWYLEGFTPSSHFGSLRARVAAARGISQEEAGRLIIISTANRSPDFFPVGERKDVRRLLEEALLND